MGSSRWPAAVLTVAGGIGAFVLSFALFDIHVVSGALFYAGPVLLVLAGTLGAWRSVLLAFAAPVLLVLLFPEGGEPQPDPGSCDPFCADPVAGLGWALGLGTCAAALACVGWLVAACSGGAPGFGVAMCR